MRGPLSVASALEIFISANSKKTFLNNPQISVAIVLSRWPYQPRTTTKAADKTIVQKISREESQFIEIYFVSRRKLNNSPRTWESLALVKRYPLIGAGSRSRQHTRISQSEWNNCMVVDLVMKIAVFYFPLIRPKELNSITAGRFKV